MKTGFIIVITRNRIAVVNTLLYTHLQLRSQECERVEHQLLNCAGKLNFVKIIHCTYTKVNSPHKHIQLLFHISFLQFLNKSFRCT